MPSRRLGAVRTRRSPSLPVGVYLLFARRGHPDTPPWSSSIVLLQRNNEAQQEVTLTLAEATAGSIAETVDRELSGMLTTFAGAVHGGLAWGRKGGGKKSPLWGGPDFPPCGRRRRWSAPTTS